MDKIEVSFKLDDIPDLIDVIARLIVENKKLENENQKLKGNMIEEE